MSARSASLVCPLGLTCGSILARLMTELLFCLGSCLGSYAFQRLEHAGTIGVVWPSWVGAPTNKNGEVAARAAVEAEGFELGRCSPSSAPVWGRARVWKRG